MSDSDEENVIRYGTPLDPIDEEEVPSKKKFQKEADQYAVDAHGRRRFHGAFTGGFSAGHGNSVATPEGFTPATFKSSRSDKAQLPSTRPEDFMDDEDRSEFGIAPRLVQTQSEFSGQKRPHQMRFHDGPIPGEPVLENLLRPLHETAAVRILKSMGWRPGQGTGERLTKTQKKREGSRQKVYGCQLPEEQSQKNEDQASSSDSEFEYDALFAPDDYEPYILRNKCDRFGLGYSGLSRHSVLGNLTGEYGSEPGTSRSHLVMKDKGKKVSIRGQAFGVGALEDEDEDIYAKEDMSHYDFTLGGASGDQGKKKDKPVSSGIIAGFVRASKPLPSVPCYRPAIPRDYVPQVRRSRFESTQQAPRDQGLGRHELSAEARGALLGETPVPKPPEPEPKPSEPSTNIPEDPIARLLGRNVNFVTTDKEKQTTTEQATEKEEDYIPISNTGSRTFKPFASNPQKQARYDSYLRGDKMVRDSGIDRLSEWERNRELVEFEQAKKLYKPLSGIMGDRFTHASEPDDQPTNPLAAVSRSKKNIGLATKAQIEAASLGLFGAITRTKTEWRPEAIVCKRFNVPDPYNARPDTKKDDKPKVSYSIFEYLESSVHNKDSFAKEQSHFSGSKSVIQNKPIETKTIEKSVKPSTETSTNAEETNVVTNKRMTAAEMFMKEYEKDVQKTNDTTAVTETIKKFDRMELYKSIFLSDSENEDEESRNAAPKPNDTPSYADFMEQPKNVERNPSPPKGIFANIDFDELNAWPKKVEEKKTEPPKIVADKEKVSNNIDESSLYGPKIPEPLKKRLEEVQEKEEAIKPTFRSRSDREKEKSEEVHTIDSSSSDSWVEASEKTKKSKKKKAKKHKSKHKKSKHKKKDR